MQALLWDLHLLFGIPLIKRYIDPIDSMKGSYLGCNYSNQEIKKYLEKINASYEEIEDQNLFTEIAKYLDEGKVIGWFNGPMELGPRH